MRHRKQIQLLDYPNRRGIALFGGVSKSREGPSQCGPISRKGKRGNGKGRKGGGEKRKRKEEEEEKRKADQCWPRRAGGGQGVGRRNLAIPLTGLLPRPASLSGQPEGELAAGLVGIPYRQGKCGNSGLYNQCRNCVCLLCSPRSKSVFN